MRYTNRRVVYTLLLYFTLGTLKVIGNNTILYRIDDFLMFIIVALALSTAVFAFDLDKYCNLEIRVRGRSRSQKFKTGTIR